MDKTEEKKEKKLSKGTRILLIIVCVLVGLAVLLAATVAVMTLVGKNALNDGSSMEVVSTDAESLSSGTIRHNGKLYKYNDELTCILLIGVDSYEKEDTGEFGRSLQSDVDVLAVVDPKNEKLTLLSVSRDTLCQLDILDDNGNLTGTGTAQLALAYSYGDGAEKSCELTATAVSRLFYGLNIPAYASIYMNGITDLVDLVGGVTVTPSDTERGFVAGKQYELYGDLTEQYIRFREDSVDGNNQRMQRQNQVLMALVYKALEMAKQNPSSVLELYGAVSDNVTTNVNTAMMVYLAQQAIKLDFDGQIHTVPGHSEMGEQNHAVFVVDEDAFLEQVLEIFYNPVEG